MDLKAVILNCTLKKSPEVSNTEALIRKVVDLMTPLGVESEIVRVVDHDVPFGVESDLGPGDDWPQIYAKLKAADIVIIGTPIWFGVRGSVAQLVIERLDGSYNDGDPVTGQFPLYGKVAGVIVTGNEDGAHDAASTTLFNLSHLGCVVPPNVDTYWVGDAGPGPELHRGRRRPAPLHEQDGALPGPQRDLDGAAAEGQPDPHQPQRVDRRGEDGERAELSAPPSGPRDADGRRALSWPATPGGGRAAPPCPRRAGP